MDEIEVPARCQRTGDGFAMTFERRGDAWAAIEAERREGGVDSSDGADLRQVEGQFNTSYEYDGCTSCGRQAFFKCGYCENLACWDGDTTEVVCPWCQETTRIRGSIDDLEAREESGLDESPSGLQRK